MAHGGYRPGAGRIPTGRKRRNYFLTDDEAAQVAAFIKNIREEEKQLGPSKYYEAVGDRLTGRDQARAYKAAANNLAISSPTYLEDVKRIWDKLEATQEK